MKKNMKTIACGVMSLLLAAPLSASTTEKERCLLKKAD